MTQLFGPSEGLDVACVAGLFKGRNFEDSRERGTREKETRERGTREKGTRERGTRERERWVSHMNDTF